MSMWDLFVKKIIDEVRAEECAPPVDMFAMADRDSVRPFAAQSILGVKTYRGVCHDFQKPSGRYRVGDPELIARNRTRQVERFLENVRLLEQEQPMPHSGIRTTHEGEHYATRKSG